VPPWRGSKKVDGEESTMWLPKPLYEGLPYYYIGLGFVALATAFLVDFRRLPEICGAAGLVCLVAGLVIWLRRRDYRASRSRLDFEKTK
jgi:hypothetical protein